MAKKKQAEKPNPKPNFLKAIDSLLAAFSGWVNDAKTNKALWAAVDAAEAAMPRKDLGKVWMHVHIAFLAFVEERKGYDDRPRPEDNPPDSFWAALDALANARKQHGKTPKGHMPPESVEQLIATVPDQGQVARMLGLIDEDGGTQLDRLQQEIKNPGSVINENYRHPNDAKQDAELDEQHAAYVAMLGGLPVPKSDRKACKETPEELYKQGVGAGQAANMLRKKIPDVEKQWAGFLEKFGPPDTIQVTDRRGQPLSEYVPSHPMTPHPFIPEEEETTVETTDEQPTSIYAQLPEAELRQLCEVGDIDDKGLSVGQMVELLEDADAKQAAGAAS